MSKDQKAALARRQQELQLVEARGQISVEELASHFGVSDDTIRRDLEGLQRRSLLVRTHGGAVSRTTLVHQETPFLIRANANADAKARIGRTAAGLIGDGETLILNGGSTTVAFAASTSLRRQLTIVTNNVAILSVISAEAIQNAYFLGGEYKKTAGLTVGDVGFASGKISVDTAVVGVTGLSVTHGLSATLMDEAPMVARMIACASRTIVVADASKFGLKAFAQIAPLSAIDILVTDVSPPTELSRALSEANVEVIVAPTNS